MYFIFLISTILFSLLGISTRRIFSSWVILEINILTFIILLFFDKREQNFTLSYFIIQRVSSRLLLLTATVSFTGGRGWIQTLLSLSLGLKLGSFPFFMWYVYILKNISWNSVILLSSIQKLIPLFILSKIEILSLPIFIARGRSLIAVFIIWNELEIKKVIAFSSLFNLGWIIARAKNFQILIMFIFAYVLSLRVVLSPLKNLNLSQTPQIIKTIHPQEKISFTAGILRMRGFPPLLGFWAKLYTSFYIIRISLELATTLIITSVIILYVYMIIALPPLIEGIRPKLNKPQTSSILGLGLLFRFPIFIYS